MKSGKRFLALLLGSILLLTPLIPCAALFSAAEEEDLVAIYASDLQKLITKAETGYSGYPVTYDGDPNGGSIGVWNGGDPKIFPKGIAIHAPSEIVFNVEGLNVKKFSAWVGLEDDLKNDGYLSYADTVFQIKADGELLEGGESPCIISNSDAYFMKVDIPAGTREVVLSNTQGASTYSDHTVWADAKFYFSSLEGMTVTDLALQESDYSLEVEKTATVEKVEPAEAPVIADYFYTVEDPTVAAVDGDGTLTALRPGKTTVTLTEAYSGISASADVCVTRETNKTYRNYNAWVAYNTKGDNPITYNKDTPNTLLMTIPTGEVRPGGNPQMLLTPAPAGNFTATVKVSGGLSKDFQSAGLIVYGGDGVCVALERRHHSFLKVNDSSNIFCHTIPTNISDAPLSDTEYIEKKVADDQKDAYAYLKITKDGNNFHCYYSYTGDNWTEVDTAPLSSTLAESENLRVGLVTRSGTYEVPTTVTFTDFTLDGQTIPFSLYSDKHEVCQFYGPNDLTFEQTGSPDAKLPETVKGYVSDGTDADIPVTWDAEALRGGATGSHTLTGHLAEGSDYEDCDLTVELTVNVTKRTSFDLSGDDILNIKDISRLLLCLETTAPAPAGDPDVNFDGQTNIEDVAVLLQMLTAGTV